MLQFPLFLRDHLEDLLYVFIFSLAASATIYKKKQKQLQQERELLNDDFNEDGE